MAQKKIMAIKNWISKMGFEKIKSLKGKDKSQINYYNLGNFGIYEEVSKVMKPGRKTALLVSRFISWNPWGVDFEVTSVNDLSKAYQDSISYNPEMVIS